MLKVAESLIFGRHYSGTRALFLCPILVRVAARKVELQRWVPYRLLIPCCTGYTQAAAVAALAASQLTPDLVVSGDMLSSTPRRISCKKLM